ncbi:MAG: DUF5930 domain-containing protein [Paracoccaceae bacterium]
MTGRAFHRLTAALERHLPEQRLFLKSDDATRFVRLRPWTQALALGGSGLVLLWTALVTAILIFDHVGAGSARDQARREQEVYEARLDALSQERDRRAAEVIAAEERFASALTQVSAMQSALLASEERRKELETGIGVIQASLRRAMTDRDRARADLQATALAAAGQSAAPLADEMSPGDLSSTVDFLTAALSATAGERDAKVRLAAQAKAETDEMAYEMRLVEERHDEIFTRLEEAVTISMEPLDKMFASVGLNPDDLIDQVRRGYSGQGGPLMPLLPEGLTAPDGAAAPSDASADRAAAILEGLDRMNLYRIAVDKTPLALPLRTAFRHTSGFGIRWGRKHAGVDLAGSYGSPVYATADGVVTQAGWDGGYGKLVTVRHDFGLETRFGHLSGIKVKVGQRVSRGDRIGDMGNTGNSTGTHLHYEVRVSGDPVNPMTFIKAGSNVF